MKRVGFDFQIECFDIIISSQNLISFGTQAMHKYASRTMHVYQTWCAWTREPFLSRISFMDSLSH